MLKTKELPSGSKCSLYLSTVSTKFWYASTISTKLRDSSTVSTKKTLSTVLDSSKICFEHLGQVWVGLDFPEKFMLDKINRRTNLNFLKITAPQNVK